MQTHQYVGALFIAILGSFFIGMLVSSIVLEVKAAKASKEAFSFVNIPKFMQNPGVTDVDYWKARHGTE